MKKIKWVLIVLWSLLAFGVIAVAFLFFAISRGWAGYVPDISELENPQYKYASQIISADGKEMGTWSYSKENRVRAEFDEIPEHLVQALVATEDARYYDHSGIDGKSLLRVIVKGFSPAVATFAWSAMLLPSTGRMMKLKLCAFARQRSWFKGPPCPHDAPPRPDTLLSR